MIAKLQPNRVRRTYLGGGRIDGFAGVVADCSDGVPRPEDWLASTVTAFNGTREVEGEGLGRLYDGRFVRDVVGDLPFLMKLLDSDERLVIQAHPTVPCAKRLFGSPVGKTECWYFLPGTAPDACVYLGFKPGVTRTVWEQAVRECSQITNVNSTRSTCSTRLNNSLLDMLHRIPVAPGDFVFVDGGIPHAIGGGCFMIELQEPSDLMVVAERTTPSGRCIPDAKMHGGAGWEKMFDVYEYDALEYEDVCRRYIRHCSQMANDTIDANDKYVSQICGSELTYKFSMWRIEGQGCLGLPRPACVVVTGGAGVVNGFAVNKGDRLLVAGERIIETEGNATLVVCA